MDNLLTKVQEHQRNHPNHFGLTVAELKVLIRDWPETNAFDVEHKVGGGDISE